MAEAACTSESMEDRVGAVQTRTLTRALKRSADAGALRDLQLSVPANALVRDPQHASPRERRSRGDLVRVAYDES
jgi:hypothetical protein